MAKSRGKRAGGKEAGRKPGKPMNWGSIATGPNRRNNIVLGVVTVVALAVAVFYFWTGNRTQAAFQALAERGKPALARIEIIPSRGGGHLAPGQRFTYPERFPTSGVHDPSPVGPGFYQAEMPPTRLVHSIEHGHIVIYYDDPGAEAIKALREWSAFYTGVWDGVVAVPASGLGKSVVLTAWARKLQLTSFERAAAAAFIDAYRGRGPENAVR